MLFTKKEASKSFPETLETHLENENIYEHELILIRNPGTKMIHDYLFESFEIFMQQRLQTETGSRLIDF